MRIVLDRVAALAGHGELWATLGCAYAQSVEGDAGPEGFLVRAVHLEPQGSQVRTVLVRRLLAQGREQDAFPHLMTLVENGVAEGAYCLGVLHMRCGRYDLALSYMEQAHGLDPAHEQTQEQIDNLRRLLMEGSA
jgi:tetratricopeptide (TPR) repeat protein